MKGLERLWYGRFPWLGLLWPLEWLFRRLASHRRRQFRDGERDAWRAPVPVVVVGNISVGGVGKTPLVMALVELLQQAGYQPGVVSRGYGGQAPHYPFRVSADSDPRHCGDEPLMIVQGCGCPLVVDPDRVQACQTLLAGPGVDLIISDDGLQHYRLQRDIEIAVIDGERGLGNGHCLPVGPLREPPSRLQEVDFCVVNGGHWRRQDCQVMRLTPGAVRTLNGEPCELPKQAVNAVAGIGNPQRFFDTLAELGYEVHKQAFADHYFYRPEDLEFSNPYPLVMTEKDAVKCRAFAGDNRYYLPVTAQLPAVFKSQFLARVAALLG